MLNSFQRRGPTLEELAELLIQEGAQYAINMDGGGSSTMAMQITRNNNDNNNNYSKRLKRRHDYDVINRPTCLDVVPFSCERRVVSVMCV
jgi:exopolysaccharide biosynthesis protein